eukprot:14015737-Alexandrium_andersonii.AAC.1
MGEDALAQQLGAPRSGALSRSVRPLSLMAQRPFGGRSEGGPNEPMWGGGPPSPMGRLGHSGAAGAPT